MTRAGWRLRAAGCWLLFLSSAAAAQTPLEGDRSFLVRVPDALAESGARPVCDGDGVCALFWVVAYRGARPPDLFAVSLAADGRVSSGPRRVATAITNSLLHVGLDHGFALLADELHADGTGTASPVLRELDQALREVRAPVELPFVTGAPPDDPRSYGGFLAMTRRAGGYTLLAHAPLEGGSTAAFLYFIDRNGVEASPRRRIDGSTDVNTTWLVAQPDGDLIFVYWRGNGLPPSDVYVMRLAPDGSPRRPEQPVHALGDGINANPLAACGPDGAFMVVWQHASEVNSTNSILARRFAADGTPEGEPFAVDDTVELDRRYPWIAADPAGNYFVTWQAFPLGAGEVLWDVRGRLFRPDGRPVTPAIRLNQDQRLEQELPVVTFAPDGVAVAGWHSVSPQQGGPVARRFAASPGQEICATWGGKLRCHLGRVGGAMQVLATTHRGEDPLLGDVDGDGRDDVCSYRAGRFSCDVAHEGVRNDWSATFGFAGDVPLLGDVDGDGRADPCVRRRAYLVCDPRHEGTEGVRQKFGRGGETARLGDVDGDGKADLCLIEGAYWSCRLSADDTRLAVVFQQSGGSPALGDVDGDGRADPCVMRKGLLTCATRHEGSAPDYRLRLEAPAGAGLVFGNVDGL